MSDDLEIIYEEQEAVEVPNEELQWSHEVLMQFELLIDWLGIETVMLLMSDEHEKILTNWIKRGVDIQAKTRQ